MRSALVTAGCAAVLGLGGALVVHTSAGAAPSDGGSPTSDGTQHGAPGEGADAKDGPQASAHAQRMVQIAHTHRDVMHQWQTCVRAAAKSGASRPASACDKPLPPGWLKHPDQHPAGQHPGDRPGQGRDDHPDKDSSERD
jgi:hypothetical protein